MHHYPKAKQIFVQSLMEPGRNLARQGDIVGAIAAYKEAQQRAPDLEISAGQWNTLCWYGSVYEQAESVMFACENAVELDPEVWFIRDSRGLARALTGDTQGAIEDFQFVVENYDNEAYQSEAQGWIEALQNGENPFTEEWLEQLR